ncbi:MAG: hypothetical protein J6W43_06640 [Prevotella sp.]|nr:hypothetical protein [Prevotella sp.]
MFDRAILLRSGSASDLPPRRHLSEIGSERRNGYGWYNSRPAMLFPVYEKWTLMH